MRMLKAQLVRDLVFLVEPTISAKVAWAGPERAGRKANSKSTCEVQGFAHCECATGAAALRTIFSEDVSLYHVRLYEVLPRGK